MSIIYICLWHTQYHEIMNTWRNKPLVYLVYISKILYRIFSFKMFPMNIIIPEKPTANSVKTWICSDSYYICKQCMCMCCCRHTFICIFNCYFVDNALFLFVSGTWEAMRSITLKLGHLKDWPNCWNCKWSLSDASYAQGGACNHLSDMSGENYQAEGQELIYIYMKLIIQHFIITYLFKC